jgi:ammonium transporter, Amt family
MAVKSGSGAAGVVRKKNVLATMAQSLAATELVSILWVAFGYSLVFTGDGALLGSASRLLLDGMGMDSINPQRTAGWPSSF